MKRMDNKKSFVLYLDYQIHLNLLTQSQKGDLLDAIFAFVNNQHVPSLEPITSMAFSFIRSQLERDMEKYTETCRKRAEAGSKGGKQKQANIANANFVKQKQANIADTVNGTVNGTVDVNGINCFIPPTELEVAEYCSDKGYALDAHWFVDFYQSKGWMVGKNKMKDWRASVRTWARRNAAKGSELNEPSSSTKLW